MRPFIVGGQKVSGAEAREVKSPWDGRVVDEVCVATLADVDRALDIAADAFERTRRQSAAERSRMLLAAAGAIRMRGEELTRLIVAEGSPTTSRRSSSRTASSRLAASYTTM